MLPDDRCASGIEMIQRTAVLVQIVDDILEVSLSLPPSSENVLTVQLRQVIEDALAPKSRCRGLHLSLDWRF